MTEEERSDTAAEVPEREAPSLVDFMAEYGGSMLSTVSFRNPPKFDAKAAIERGDMNKFKPLLRRPLGNQGLAILGVVESMRRNRGTVLVGEMGSGKTFCSLAAASIYAEDNGIHERVVILAPTSIMDKWATEVKMTVPNAMVRIVRGIGEMMDVEREAKKMDEGRAPKRPIYVVMSVERSRSSYARRPAYVLKRVFHRHLYDEAVSALLRKKGEKEDEAEKKDEPRYGSSNSENNEVEGMRESSARDKRGEDAPKRGRLMSLYDNFGERLLVACCPECHAPLMEKNGRKQPVSFRAKTLVEGRSEPAGREGYRDAAEFPVKGPGQARDLPPYLAETEDPQFAAAVKGLSTRMRKGCGACGSYLWTAERPRRGKPERVPVPPARPSRGDRATPGVYSLCDYVGRRMPKGFFDVFIADEVHKFKEKTSAQGVGAGQIAQAAKRTVALTGTFMGGYSSTMFFLLYRFGFNIRDEYDYNGVTPFVKRYGFSERTFTEDPNGKSTLDNSFGSQSRRDLKGHMSQVKEIPGLMPSALVPVLGNMVTLRMKEVMPNLTSYEEKVLTYELSDEKVKVVGPNGEAFETSQLKAYRHVYDRLREALEAALKDGDKSLLGAYLNTLLAYPDGVTRGERVTHPHNLADVIVDYPPLPENVVYPKERALIDLVKSEIAKGRRCAVYITHTGTRDITHRIERLLTNEGVRCYVERSGEARTRAERIKEKLRRGEMDALIVHPKKIEVGVDLPEFPTIVWYETEYSTYVTRQASRRSYRPQQTKPVRVYFMTYENTLQEDALLLCAKKALVSMRVEGDDYVSGGLASLGESTGSLFDTLTRVMSGTAVVEGSLEETFAEINAEEALSHLASSDLLVDEETASLIDEAADSLRPEPKVDVSAVPAPAPAPTKPADRPAPPAPPLPPMPPVPDQIPSGATEETAVETAVEAAVGSQLSFAF